MKKFLVLMLVLVCGHAAVAGSCDEQGWSTVVLVGNQYASDDEFLFDSEIAFDDVGETNGTYDIRGRVWECDSEYCADGKTVTLSPGHVFNGKKIGETVTYKCHTSWHQESYWEPVKGDMTCGEAHISFDGTQVASDKEFLYSTKTAYDSVKDREDSAVVSGGLVYECDNLHCMHGVEKTLSSGHVFGGVEIKRTAKYRCVHRLMNDFWEEVFDNGCQYRGVFYGAGEWYSDVNGRRIVLTYSDCSQIQDMNPADINTRFNLKCEKVGENIFENRCYPVGGEENPKECLNGGSKNIKSSGDCRTGTFVCTDKDATGNCICGKCVENGGGRVNTCKSQRTTDEGKACCDLAESVATWDGNNCNCVAEGMEFKIKDGKGVCQVKPGLPGEPFNCNADVLAQLDVWAQECEKNAQILNIIQKIKELCRSDNRTREDFNLLYATLLALNPGDCVAVVPPQPPRDTTVDLLIRSRRKISDAHTALRGMMQTFKVSVWKDKEGDFNTARLASDSIAAVVLGTTGALITSSVVKKNQVENGFEDIKCTIGGQTVADYGDQFRVGIQ